MHVTHSRPFGKSIPSKALPIRTSGACRSAPSAFRKASTRGATISMAAAPNVLVSFDVDGTLIRSIGLSANKLHKDAFAAGFKDVFGVDTHIDVVQHHGATDPLIVIKVMEHHGIGRDKIMESMPRVKEVMNSYFLTNASRAGDGLEMLAGVKDFLEALQGTGQVASCLVTGNLEPIGWTKMKALGIDHLFTDPKFGGFGSDVCSGNVEESWRDRAEMVRVAASKGPSANNWKARYHVGDTPMDIMAALDAGAVAIGVTTGIYTAEQLRDCAPPNSEAEGRLIILPGLQDTQGLLKFLGLA